jgi:hypothetical protein
MCQDMLDLLAIHYRNCSKETGKNYRQKDAFLEKRRLKRLLFQRKGMRQEPIFIYLCGMNVVRMYEDGPDMHCPVLLLSNNVFQ